MKFIGISGYKGSGKTTVAHMLEEVLAPARCVHINFADALKVEVSQMYNVSVKFIEEHKDNFRLILQGHGTDFRRRLYHEQYWIKKYLSRCTLADQDVAYIITSDIRFNNEYAIIKELYGPIIRVARNINTDPHPSETELDGKDFDFVILNTGSLDDLRNEVNNLKEKIK
jgi:energy-coupling factor transporter ATP-binding protein EcfA2